MAVSNAAVIATLAVDAYDVGTEAVEGLPPGFVRLAIATTGAAPLRAAAYFNAATGELVVAYCGSESLRSEFTSFSFVESTAADSALNQALAFVDTARQTVATAFGVSVDDSAIHLTGHGVGGGFASLVSVACSLSATTFNGTRIGALIEAMEDRFGPLDDNYAGRIVNYVLQGEAVTTMPRGATQIGQVADLAASDLTFSGQLSTALGRPTQGSTVLDAVYDWLAADSTDRQRAQRTLMALELEFGAVAASDLMDAARSQALTEQLNRLMQTSYADTLRDRSFDRLMIDGSDYGQTQDASAYGMSNDLLIGADGADRLFGGRGTDVLLGGDGNDVLDGGPGADFLYGGAGADLYALGWDAGEDVIRDTQGANRLTIDGRGAGGAFIEDPAGGWRSADGRSTLRAVPGGAATLTQGAVSVTLQDFAEGSFGVHRFARRATPAVVLTGDRVAGDPADYIVSGNAGETIYAGLGDDWVESMGGDDVVFGGAGTDLLYGGAGADWLYGGDDAALADVIGQASAASGTRGDWLAGNAGDDVLVGTAADDVLSGGAGRDVLIGGGGRDVIFGDADYAAGDFEWVMVVYADGSTNYSGQGALDDPAGSAADVIYAGAGNDYVIAGRGDDLVYGGDGDDVLLGGPGADTLFGEGGRDQLYGSTRTPSIDRSEDFLDGGDGADMLRASDGDNTLLGGAGDDVIYSGAGNDYIDAGDGDDQVVVSIGADVVYGGRGDDVIRGTSTQALMFDGGDGDDILSSDLGDDTLRGGDGDDLLIGNEGSDTLDGGLGDDTYRFHLGDGIDTVLDAGGNDTIEIVSEAAGAITRDQIRLVADAAELWLSYGNGGDRIRLGVDPAAMIENVALRTVSGATETVERWTLASMGVTLEGTASSEALFAVMGFANTIRAGGGNDVLLGGDRDDVLEGGDGDDLMKGGEGADRYVIGQGAGLDTIDDDGTGGLDELSFAASAAGVRLGLADGALFIDLGGGNGVKVAGFQADNAENTVAIEQFRFADATLSAGGLLARGFDLVGSELAQIITGTSVADRFVAGRGNEKLVGGKGNDTYTFSRGFGRDLVVDQDDTAGNFDRIVFTDVRSSDVTVKALADRLVLEVTGSDDVLEVQWAPHAGARIESIEFSDGLGWDVQAIESRFRPANADPRVERPLVDQSARQDTAFRFVLPAGTFRDPDAGDALTLTASLADGEALPGWLDFDGAAFAGTPGNADVGRVVIRVTATDPSGATAFDEFEIGVENVNDAPTVAAPLPDIDIAEDESFSYTIPAGTFVDIDAGDTLRYVAALDSGSSLPAWLRFDQATGTFSGTPGNAEVGTVSVVVMAIDRVGAIAKDRFDLTVLNENDAPELVTPLGDVSGKEGHLLEIEVPAATFRDIDRNDLLTLSARLADGGTLPPWLAFDAETATFSGAPTRADIGSYTVRLTATDSEGAFAFDDFVITIAAVPGMTLYGGAGNDTLIGDAGDDTLAGRGGADTLIGGAGDDRFLFNRDAVWGDGERRVNLGSPTGAGTGESASIARLARSYDVFLGGSGMDTLQGTSGADAILLDDLLSPANSAGARIQDIEIILAGAGNDVIDLTSTSYTLGNVRVEGGSGADVIWSSGGDDILLGGAGADRIFGGAGHDYLGGEGGGDDLNGGLGNDVLQGGSGNDRLLDGAGGNVIDGRGGADEILEGEGNSFIAGGTGGDRISLGGGFDVVAFNRGDGRDVIRGSGAATLSLGGGIRYDQLAMRKSGADLVLEVSPSDRISFQDWYAAPANESVLNLQVIAEVMQGYSAASADPLLDDKVEHFDFGLLVDRFDAARAAQPTLSRWTVMNALLDAHLGGSDTAALGGDLAYQYGVKGALTGIGLTAAQQIAGDAAFGRSAQSLLSAEALAQGPIKLV
jgi:Ca2+-binding RTX toxin-like protein